MLGLLLSAAMLVGAGGCLARWLGRTWAERFWIGVASVALHLGVIATICSVLGQLRPVPWLIVQAVLLVVLLGCRRWWGALADGSQRDDANATPSRSSAWLTAILAGALAIVLGVSGLLQYYKPINDFDGRLYHGSRCLYWIQHRSLFAYETHNERQTDFPLGGEIFFMWPVLFTRVETVGRLIFWLGYPLSVIGSYTLLRQLSTSRNAALAGALAYAVTPTVSYYAVQLKPEMWTALFTIGIAFWALRPFHASADRERSFFAVGIFFALSVNARFTVMALFPALLLLPWLIPAVRFRLQALLQLTLGTAAGAALSGMLLVLLHNVAAYGHPLGGKEIRRLVSAEISCRQLVTHAVRVPFLLLELPLVPGARLRQAATHLGAVCAARLGADTRLPLERPDMFPGCFTFTVPEYAERFSLPGLLWGIALLVCGLGLCWQLLRTAPRCRLGPVGILALLALPLFAGIVVTVRWMACLERFWICPYALGLPLGIVLMARWASRSRLVRGLVWIVVPVLVVVPLKQQLEEVRAYRHDPCGGHWWLGDPNFAVLPQVRDGRLLLIASQGIRDYSLFNPWQRYHNEVYLWGQRPWDPGRLRELLVTHAITHVVIEDMEPLYFLDRSVLETRPIFTWLQEQPDLVEIPLKHCPLRLFRVGQNSPANMLNSM